MRVYCLRDYTKSPGSGEDMEDRELDAFVEEVGKLAISRGLSPKEIWEALGRLMFNLGWSQSTTSPDTVKEDLPMAYG